MFTRYAYFIGRPVEGASQQFVSALRAAAAEYADLPRVRSVYLDLPVAIDEGAPPIFASIRLTFGSAADIDAALASPERQLARALFADKVLPLFDGKVVHINNRGIQYC